MKTEIAAKKKIKKKTNNDVTLGNNTKRVIQLKRVTEEYIKANRPSAYQYMFQ